MTQPSPAIGFSVANLHKGLEPLAASLPGKTDLTDALADYVRIAHDDELVRINAAGAVDSKRKADAAKHLKERA